MSAPLLTAHIVIGSLGIVLGPVVIWQDTRLLRDGNPPHSRIGGLYHAVVLLICGSAVGLVITIRTDLWFLIPVAAASYSLVLTGRLAGAHRFRGWTHAYAHGIGGSYIALVTALVVVRISEVVDHPFRTKVISHFGRK